jgi:hypothetical protein
VLCACAQVRGASASRGTARGMAESERAEMAFKRTDAMDGADGCGSEDPIPF